MNRRSSPRPRLWRSGSRASLATLTALCLLALTASGCGGGGSEGSTGAQTKPSPYARGGSAESQAPRGSSPALREIYRQFPAPKADPEVKASAAAIAAGKKACAGKAPLEVKEAFYPVAIEQGGLEQDSPQAKMIAAIDSYEKRVDGSFVAGQLAAGAYAATLPQARSQFGYQGCIYSLALRVKRELAPKRAQ